MKFCNGRGPLQPGFRESPDLEAAQFQGRSSSVIFGCAPRRLYGWVFPVPGCTILRAFGRLPEQGNGETTARCHRRDINLTANNAPLILPHASLPMLLRVFITIISNWMQNLSRAENESDVKIEQIMDDEFQNIITLKNSFVVITIQLHIM